MDNIVLASSNSRQVDSGTGVKPSFAPRRPLINQRDHVCLDLRVPPQEDAQLPASILVARFMRAVQQSRAWYIHGCQITGHSQLGHSLKELHCTASLRNASMPPTYIATILQPSAGNQ